MLYSKHFNYFYVGGILMKEKCSNIWESVLDYLKEELDNQVSFKTWFMPSKLISLDENAAIIQTPNDLVRKMLEDRYKNLLKKGFLKILNRDISIEIIVDTDNIPEKMKDQAKNTALENEKGTEFISTPLNPKYTFDTFVIGNSNRFAHAASLAVAEAPAKAYNPLFIYGGVGLGKTHLMHAIGHFILDNNPDAKVLYVSSEKFTNELINSIRDDRNVQFRNKYRSIDVLLVDDIQFIAGKERTQEEFFHTFNALYEASKQIIISSDRPPKEIPTLEERLRSRFEWGLITDIQPPDLETRIAILRKKAKMENLDIPNEVMLYIAKKIKTNIRELEGALIRIMAYSSLTNQEINVQLAKEALKDILPESKTKKIDIPLIQKIVGEYYNLSIEDFKSKKRTRAVAYPRQIAMYLSRELTDYSLPQIGEEFGGRDHTTVLHAYDKISKDIESNPSFKKRLDEIISKIKS